MRLIGDMFLKQLCQFLVFGNNMSIVHIGFTYLGYSGQAAYSNLVPNETRTSVIT